MNTHEAFAEANRLARLIDAGVDALRTQSKVLAGAERDYRRAKAESWVKCPRDEGSNRDWTAGRREAWVNADTADLRYQRDLAEGLRQAALEAVRARGRQISVLQSLLAADRAEAEFVRVSPVGGP